MPQAGEGRAGGRRRGGGRRKKEPKRFGRMLPLLVGALVVALIALGTVLYFQLSGEDAEEQVAQETRPALYRVQDSGDTSNVNEVLASREADSRPLNEGELFERHNAEISGQSIDFTLRDSDLTEDCSAAVWGALARQALADADCSQAGRATYLSDGYFGVVGVFNLADIEGSRAVADALNLPEAEEGAEEEEAAEPVEDPGFVLPPSGESPFDRLGAGYSSADAIVTGHYLVVVWVQPTDSESVEERVSLATPLVTLANFRDPFFRRIGELGGGSQTDEGTDGTDTEGTTGTDGTGTEGTTGTDGTGTEGTAGDPPGEAPGTEGEQSVPGE
ncbi:hypothetical protein GCM10007079_32840 [Nocardiopsis terrae]|uniref:Uncharacterized protein n=2 Tax=Nocardiopsis terrae TaxID=372655 RepID=A0ABR9HJD6_9ACTN|nr:hypothetical protein [Nocardiopsis terrae]GHC88125.1 hypothetical protein GCM10007079_32840 [Nocardiopsis terrae]